MHSSNPPLYKGGLNSSNLAVRVEMKYFFLEREAWTKGAIA